MGATGASQEESMIPETLEVSDSIFTEFYYKEGDH